MEEKVFKLSHSKLNCILNNPMEYYLKYEVGLSVKQKKTALVLGSAVHWGLENNTSDLTEYWGKNCEWGQEQILSEAMLEGFFKHKEEIFEKILTKDGEKLTLLQENHELYLEAHIDSGEFVGIIDLLLLTDKGFIILDYKTSSMIPDWDSYIDQIYRYIFLLKEAFPDVPICKIGIINLRKSGIRKKKNENNDEFLNRLRFEYKLNDEDLINYHEYLPEEMDENLINRYISNLKQMCLTAKQIVDSGIYYINYSGLKNQYGKSDYYPIIYNEPDAYLLYDIKDVIWNAEEQEFEQTRDALPIDMKILDEKVLNKFEIFKKEADKFLPNVLQLRTALKEKFFDYLKDNYTIDNNLLEIYWETLSHV